MSRMNVRSNAILVETQSFLQRLIIISLLAASGWAQTRDEHVDRTVRVDPGAQFASGRTVEQRPANFGAMS
jgi:hypothetical protein